MTNLTTTELISAGAVLVQLFAVGVLMLTLLGVAAYSIYTPLFGRHAREKRRERAATAALVKQVPQAQRKGLLEVIDLWRRNYYPEGTIRYWIEREMAKPAWTRRWV